MDSSRRRKRQEAFQGFDDDELPQQPSFREQVNQFLSNFLPPPMDSSRRRKRQEAFQGFDDDDLTQQPRERKARFPKGKKQKQRPEDDDIFGDSENESGGEEAAIKGTAPRLAARQRAVKRKTMADELLDSRDTSVLDDVNVNAAEEAYENEDALEDDGVVLEPFNLNEEREEGYFDSAGNYVEYTNENKIRDAWLESVEANARFSKKQITKSEPESEDEQSLSREDLGKMKRRIANVLQPGETVLKALRRLKGTSGNQNKREKMPPETKAVFDQLTEDAMKLMENGETNVYEEEKNTFEREAEGYEAVDPVNKEKNVVDGEPSNILSSPGDDEDIFANDDVEEQKQIGEVPDQDYVYDPSSGYYYSSKHGYYYDPNSGFFWNAVSGKWYKFNEGSNTYEELKDS